MPAKTLNKEDFTRETFFFLQVVVFIKIFQFMEVKGFADARVVYFLYECILQNIFKLSFGYGIGSFQSKGKIVVVEWNMGVLLVQAFLF